MKRIEMTDRQQRILLHFLARSFGNEEYAKSLETKILWDDRTYNRELRYASMAIGLAKSLNTTKEWR